MTATTLAEDDSAIRIPTRFDFRFAQDFDRAAGKAVGRVGSEIVIDLTNAAYIDSSGLGMLLVLRDSARASGKSVVLKGASGAVQDVLGIANFHKIFAFR